MKKIIISSLLLTVIANILILQQSSNLSNINNIYTMFFYIHDINFNFTFLVIYLIAFVWCVLLDIYEIRHNHFDYNIIERIGYNKNFKNNLKSILLKTFIFKLLFDIMFIASQWIRGLRFSFEYNPTMFQDVTQFSENLMNNLIIYTITSLLGMMLLSIFIYSLIDYINNKYIFLLFMPAMCLLTTILYIIMYKFLYNPLMTIVNDDRITRIILTIYSPFQLIEPGMLWKSYGLLSFGLSFALLGVITVILLVMSRRKRLIYG